MFKPFIILQIINKLKDTKISFSLWKVYKMMC